MSTIVNNFRPQLKTSVKDLLRNGPYNKPRLPEPEKLERQNIEGIHLASGKIVYVCWIDDNNEIQIRTNKKMKHLLAKVNEVVTTELSYSAIVDKFNKMSIEKFGEVLFV